MATQTKRTILITYVGANGGEWEIRLGKDQVVYCNCPAWRFSKKKPRSCKHLVLFREDQDSGYEVEQDYVVITPAKKPLLRRIYI